MDDKRPWNDARELVLEELLTIGEVAALLKVPTSWIYERTRRRGKHRLPHIKLGKYLRFEGSAVREFLQQQRQAFK